MAAEAPRYERTLWRWTVEDADRQAGRELTDDELERVKNALDNSTVNEAFGDVVFTVTSADLSILAVWDVWRELSNHLVAQGWTWDGRNQAVEKGSAMVHLNDPVSPTPEIMLTFDHFLAGHLQPPLDTVADYLREIDIELARYQEGGE